ncbi:MAG: DUF2817 domain-containing protein [Cyanobacteria bacterium P01_G01_bin.39]
MPSVDYPLHFDSKYAKARHNFLAASSDSATLIRSWQHPLRGIAGEKLYLDLSWFGDLAAPVVLVLISGTHGVEGYCGSGIQVGSIKTGWQLQADQRVAIAMIHGLNPHGMSHLRRVNEDGVDLNRNFLDFQQPLPQNTLYDDLAEIIVPQQWTPEIQVQTLDQITEYLYHQPSGIAALAQGQYHYWYAPFYGGEVATWSNRVFNSIIDQYLLDKKAVGLLDYHTGLGTYATGQLMSVDQNQLEQSKLAKQIWGEKLVIAGSAKSVAAYSPQGTLIAALKKRLNSSICVAAAYEFGTIPDTEVFHALRADHWLHAHGDLNSLQAQTIKQNMLNAFYSDRPDWQQSICELAFTAQNELLTGLQELPN